MLASESLSLLLYEISDTKHIDFIQKESGQKLLDFLEPRYVFVRWIARGGEGIIFLSKDIDLDEYRIFKVALPHFTKQNQSKSVFRKLLKKSFRDEDDPASRFLRGTKHQAGLSRIIPKVFGNIPSIFKLSKNPLYVEMEFFETRNLMQWCKEKYSDREIYESVSHDVLIFFWNLCKIVQILHKKGVVHRDLKPQNILVGNKNRVVLVDFSFCKNIYTDESHTMVEMAGGSPLVCPKEALEDFTRCRESADIYSLMFTFWQIALGESPRLCMSSHEAVKKPEKTMQRQRQIMPSIKLPEEFRALFIKSTQVNPKNRYEFIDSFLRDYEKILEMLGVNISPENKGITKLVDTKRLIRKDYKVKKDGFIIDDYLPDDRFREAVRLMWNINIKE